VTVNIDGSFTYTPRSAFTGNDSFSYAVADAAGDTRPGPPPSRYSRPLAIASGTTCLVNATKDGEVTVSPARPWR
jgi:Bacterial Ig domain